MENAGGSNFTEVICHPQLKINFRLPEEMRGECLQLNFSLFSFPRRQQQLSIVNRKEKKLSK